MEKIIGIIIVLCLSIILLLVGYNAIFRTDAFLKKYVEMAKYKKGSYMYNSILSKSNLFWTKIGGIAIIIFSIVLFSIVLYRLYIIVREGL
jgi:hypothetical protein